MSARISTCLLLVAVACGNGAEAGGSAPEEPQMQDTPDPFCAVAAAEVGHPGGEVQDCTPLLPDLYWVRVTVPDGGFAGAVVTEAGRAVTDRGCAVGAAWLRRIRVYDLQIPRPVLLVQGLEAVGALPDGFTAAHLTDRQDPSGVSRLTLRPFRLELVKDEPVPQLGGLGSPAGPGRTPPPQRRALLTGDADYGFTWTIEQRPGGGAWAPVSTIACD